MVVAMAVAMVTAYLTTALGEDGLEVVRHVLAVDLPLSAAAQCHLLLHYLQK